MRVWRREATCSSQASCTTTQATLLRRTSAVTDVSATGVIAAAHGARRGAGHVLPADAEQLGESATIDHRTREHAVVVIGTFDQQQFLWPGGCGIEGHAEARGNVAIA